MNRLVPPRSNRGHKHLRHSLSQLFLAQEISCFPLLISPPWLSLPSTNPTSHWPKGHTLNSEHSQHPVGIIFRITIPALWKTMFLTQLLLVSPRLPSSCTREMLIEGSPPTPCPTTCLHPPPTDALLKNTTYVKQGLPKACILTKLHQKFYLYSLFLPWLKIN